MVAITIEAAKDGAFPQQNATENFLGVVQMKSSFYNGVLFSRVSQRGNVSPCGSGLWKPLKNASVRSFVMLSSRTFVAKSLQKRGLYRYPPRFCGGSWTWWRHLFGLDGGIHGVQVTARIFFIYVCFIYCIIMFIFFFLHMFVFVSMNIFQLFISRCADF